MEKAAKESGTDGVSYPMFARFLGGPLWKDLVPPEVLENYNFYVITEFRNTHKK